MPGSADQLMPQVGMREVAAMHNVTEAAKATAIPAANIGLATELSKKVSEKQTPVSVLKEVAEGGETPSYEASSGQQDIARLGGEAGRLNAAGKAEAKPNITTAQQERLDRGRSAIESVSAVMYYTDILKLPEAPPNIRQDAINQLIAKDPNFAALGIATVADLEARAVTGMYGDPSVQRLLDSMPHDDGTPLTEAEKKGIIQFAMMTNPDFRDQLGQNFQKLHDRLLKLQPPALEGRAKLAADKANAESEMSRRATAIAERLNRDPSVSPKPTAAEIANMLKTSGTEGDFRKSLAVALGVPAANIDAIVAYQQAQDLVTQATRALDEAIRTNPKITKANRDILEKRINDFKAKLPPAPDAGELAIYAKASGIVAQQDTRADVAEGIKASIHVVQVDADIARLGAGTDTSTEMSRRLDQEDAIIREMEKVMGKSLGEVWSKQMDKANEARAELIKQKIETASTDAEKQLLRLMSTQYVEYDASRRETVIHGDRIMEGAQLMAFKDRGLMLMMARDMGILPAGEPQKVSDIFDIKATGTGPTETAGYLQQQEIDRILSTVTPENRAALEKMMQTHGSEYRQKVYGSYLTMREYFKEGVVGTAIRFGHKVKYDGEGWRLGRYLKGDLGLNTDELKNLYDYCKDDMDAAVKSNRDAQNFIRKMQEKGMVGSPETFKKLLWLLMVIFGLGGGAMLGPAGAVAGVGVGLAGKLGGSKMAV